MLIADFTASQSTDLKNLVITDASTANYDGETITGREIEITHADGETETIPFPIVIGPGDTYEYPVTVDAALKVKLTLIPASVNPDSDYSKVKYLLVSGNTEKCILQRSQVLIFSSDPKNVLTIPEDNLDLVIKIEAFFKAASRLIAIGDLTGAQEAIEICGSLCNKDCGCSNG